MPRESIRKSIKDEELEDIMIHGESIRPCVQRERLEIFSPSGSQ